MNKLDTAKVLTIAAGFDNRRVDDVMTTAWMELLNAYTYMQCRQAVIDHYRDSETRHQYLTAAHVLDRVEGYARAKRHDVEADVRSAISRGLIGADWPRREPLPEDVAARLAFLREKERAEAQKYLELDAPTEDDE